MQQNRKYYADSNDTSQCDMLKVDNIKNYAFNSQNTQSPHCMSETPKLQIAKRTQKPSFNEGWNDMNVQSCLPTTKKHLESTFLKPVMEGKIVKSGNVSSSHISYIPSKARGKRMNSYKTTTEHTECSSMNKEQPLLFESTDLYACKKL